MGLSAFFMLLAGPLAKRVLTALGIGLVSFVGMSAAVGAILNEARAGWGGMNADVAVYVAMSGANVGLSLIVGAILGRVSLMALKKLTLL